MAGGKARGVNRGYQVQCRDVLVAKDPTLTPWAGDGIDVSFPLGDTAWSLDVALRATDGGLVVAECRRTIRRVKQEDIGGFAYRVEQLRKDLGIPVAGLFIAKTGHQKGAIKVGQYNGIRIVVLAEGERPRGFTMTYLRYDREREQVLRDLMKSVASGEYTLEGQPVGLRHGTVIRPGAA